MEKLGQLLNASLASRMVLVGIEHGIFDQLKEPISVSDLADKDGRYSYKGQFFSEKIFLCPRAKVSCTFVKKSCPKNYCTFMYFIAEKVSSIDQVINNNNLLF